MKKLIILSAIAFITTTGFAQMNQPDQTKPKTEKKEVPAKPAKYECPMHADIKSDVPGKCSKCGMNLVAVKTFVCPMHKDVTSNVQGKCPKCGMDLVEKKS